MDDPYGNDMADRNNLPHDTDQNEADGRFSEYG